MQVIWHTTPEGVKSHRLRTSDPGLTHCCTVSDSTAEPKDTLHSKDTMLYPRKHAIAPNSHFLEEQWRPVKDGTEISVGLTMRGAVKHPKHKPFFHYILRRWF